MLIDIPSGKAGEIFMKFAEPNYSFTRIGVKKKNWMIRLRESQELTNRNRYQTETMKMKW